MQRPATEILILEHTPKNNVRTPDVCSQVTPVNKIMQKWRQNNQIESPLPRALTHVDTPETPLGAFIRADPSPNLRKDMARFLDTLPDWKPPPERRMSTVRSFGFISLAVTDFFNFCSRWRCYRRNCGRKYALLLPRRLVLIRARRLGRQQNLKRRMQRRHVTFVTRILREEYVVRVLLSGDTRES